MLSKTAWHEKNIVPEQFFQYFFLHQLHRFTKMPFIKFNVKIIIVCPHWRFHGSWWKIVLKSRVNVLFLKALVIFFRLKHKTNNDVWNKSLNMERVREYDMYCLIVFHNCRYRLMNNRNLLLGHYSFFTESFLCQFKFIQLRWFPSLIKIVFFIEHFDFQPFVLKTQFSTVHILIKFWKCDV